MVTFTILTKDAKQLSLLMAAQQEHLFGNSAHYLSGLNISNPARSFVWNDSHLNFTLFSIRSRTTSENNTLL